jgi:hypothetical protein
MQRLGQNLGLIEPRVLRRRSRFLRFASPMEDSSTRAVIANLVVWSFSGVFAAAAAFVTLAWWHISLAALSLLALVSSARLLGHRKRAEHADALRQ